MSIQASQVLRQYWKNEYPVDPVVIANELGIRVYTKELDNSVSGYIGRNHETKQVEIYVNANHPLVRQRFTIAHELGHFFLAKDFDKKRESDYISESDERYMYRRDSLYSSKEERDANQFAAELLMPRKALEYAIKKYNDKDIKFLATVFQVSLDALVYRLRNLGYDI